VVQPDQGVDTEMLLAFLYRSPIAMVEVSANGAMGLMNPRAVAVLGPFAQGPMRNFFEDFGNHFEDIRALIQGYQVASGEICREYRIDVTPNIQELGELLYFTFTISKLSPETFFICFDDVTAQVIAEEENKRLVARMLHDLGNAISGIATRVARLACEGDWPEALHLERLLALVASERSAFDATLGQGKGQRLESFLSATIDLLRERASTFCNDVSFLTTSIQHVEQVMNIHRHYVASGLKRCFETLDVYSLLKESLSIIQVLFEQKQITLDLNLPPKLPKFRGDRTKLLQLLINVLKNAVESMEDSSDKEPPSIKIDAEIISDFISIKITDNGVGFDQVTASKLFQRGFTSKESGTGIGLYNCREIALAHGGDLTLESEGVGRGATAMLRLMCSHIDQDFSEHDQKTVTR
jgi:signal transduction histidine kinase